MEHALMEQWPKGPDGEPEEAVLLERAPDFPGYGELRCSQLAAFGIPFYTRRPGGGLYLKLVFGFSCEGLDIFVPASRLEEAQKLLTAAETAAELEEEESQ